MQSNFRYIILNVMSVLMASCFTACNNDNPENPNDKLPIEISATIEDDWKELSRVIVEDDGVSIAAFKNDDKIIVDAWRLPAGKSSVSYAPDVFRRKEMFYKDGVWDYGTKKFWSDTVNDKLVFYAYHLDGANCTVNEDWDEKSRYPTIKFDDVNYSSDILVAPVNIVNRRDKVQLNFRHIMARFKLEMRYWDEDESNQPKEDESVYVEKVTFWNYPKAAVFKGFDDNEDPIWEITEYPTGSGWRLATGVILEAGPEFKEIPGSTRFWYPFLCDHAEDPGNDAKYGFVIKKQDENGEYTKEYAPGEKGNNIEKRFDFPVKGGYSYTFQVTVRPNNDIKIEIKASASNHKWDEEYNYGTSF